MSAEQKPICVVIDANIWRQNSSLLLRTPMGSALLYILRQSSGYIGLPEIIEQELIKHTLKSGLDAVGNINKEFKTIETIMGSSHYTVPDQAKLEAVIKERLTDLEDLFIRVPFTLEHARLALRRVFEGTPPNGLKNQQFKDSAIWEAILTLSDSYTIYFISEDSGFFRGDKKTEKLANNLLDECKKKGAKVYIYNNMASCIKALQEDVPPLDYSNLILKIDELINTQLRQGLLDDSQCIFEITELVTKKSSVWPFLTENNKKLALSFQLSYSCNDVYNDSGDKMKDAILITKGNCLYELATEIFSDITIDFEEIEWTDPSGERRRRRILEAALIGSSNS